VAAEDVVRTVLAEVRAGHLPAGGRLLPVRALEHQLGLSKNTVQAAYDELVARGALETREREGEFGIDFQNADRFTATYTDTYEFLPRPFRIASNVTLPVGGYDFNTVRLAFNRANRQRVAGNLSFETGTFYNGYKTAIGLTAGRVNFSPRFSVEPTYSVNWVELTEGKFTSQLFGSRVTFTATPFMFTSALVQYNSETHSVSTNVRFRWEYRPGSEFFVVYNDERDTYARAFPDLTNRAFIVKINRLFRF